MVRLAVLSQFEYRFNLFIDTILQPLIIAAIEATLWYAIFVGMQKDTLGGFPRESYLVYAIWATFIGRITTNWMYEFRMMHEIETGRINNILVRPISFYEYYLWQFLGYKGLSSFLSLAFPVLICWIFDFQLELWRLPMGLALMGYYVIFAHTLSFFISTFAFYYNRVHSLTVGKNIALWILAGESFPLDITPEPLRSWIYHLPFASGVFVPTAFITGRIQWPELMQGFINVTWGLIIVSLAAAVNWNLGRRTYSGTGA